MFTNVSPESAGIESKRVQNFLEKLESYKYDAHSVIMARGDKIFTEAYYAPYNENSLQRTYAVSESFVSVAVGMAIDDGLLSIDDKLVDLLSEYSPDPSDALLARVTVRDLLSMRASMIGELAWWGKPDRAAEYFKRESKQVPNTNFYYDSENAFLLAVIVEKLTGKPILDYMKDKGLRDIGFSEESYSLLAPGGHSNADSSLMCKLRDLLIFGRLVIGEGEVAGKRLVSRDFMKTATSHITSCVMTGDVPLNYCDGYGYLFWIMPDGCICCAGMADQYIFIDPKNDFVFAITSENMGWTDMTRPLIFHMIYDEIRPYFSEPLPECPEEYNKLVDYIESRELAHYKKTELSSVASQINGKTYALSDNTKGVTTLRLDFSGNEGALILDGRDGEERIEFGIGYNKFGKLPGKLRISKTASVYEDGAYDCAISGEWIDERKLKITVRVIDTYLGKVIYNISFDGDDLSIVSAVHAQRILNKSRIRANGKQI